MKTTFQIVLCLLASAFGPGTARAVELAPATFDESIGAAQTSVNGVDPLAPESIVVSVMTVDYGSADGVATTVGGAHPSVDTHLDINGYAPYGTAGGGAARIFYYWAVEQVGGAPYEGLVPIRIVASGNVSRGIAGDVELGLLYAFATFNLHNELVQLEASLCDAQGCYTGGDGFAESFVADVALDTAYSVQLHTNGYDAVEPAATASFQAAAEAVLVIDPDFARAGDFRIVYSAGIAPAADADSDGRADVVDNCLDAANDDQRDTDADGIGNVCDGDFDQNCIVNFADLGILKAALFQPGDLDTDMNGDGETNFSDVGLFKAGFFAEPGPSGVPNPCATP
jgi:hypothetical protein